MIGDLPHRQGAHPMSVSKPVEFLKDPSEEREILGRVDAEVMRMPPEMKDRSGERRPPEASHDPPPAKSFEAPSGHRPKEQRGRHVAQAIGLSDRGPGGE